MTDEGISHEEWQQWLREQADACREDEEHNKQLELDAIEDRLCGRRAA